MKTYKKIRVTRRDILLGRRAEARRCPVALSVARYVGRAALVDQKRISIYNLEGRMYEWRELWRHGNLPLKARQFVHRFDHFRRVQPFTFLVEI